MIREIAGHQNHSVKLARKLQKKKFRRERGLLVGEGMDLLLAAVAGGADVRELLVRRELLEGIPAGLRERAAAFSGPGSRTPVDEDSVTAGVDIGVCNQETLDYASSLGGSADVIFICLQPEGHLADVDLGSEIVLYLEGVGDPGNVGTLCRSAVAFGLGGLVCSPGSADPWSPKALRAGMGAQFSLPVVTEVEVSDLQGRFRALAAQGHPAPLVLIADSSGGRNVADITDGANHERAKEKPQGILLVLGNERSGPSPEWEAAVWGPAQRVTIPQQRFDSLNVAMAGTVLAYELSRFTARRPAL